MLLLCAKRTNSLYRPCILVVEKVKDIAEMKFAVACRTHNIRHRQSLLSTPEHAADRPGKANELFQQFLPESTHNRSHPLTVLRKSLFHCSLISTASCSTKFTLHTFAPIYSTTQVITKCIRPLNEKHL